MLCDDSEGGLGWGGEARGGGDDVYTQLTHAVGQQKLTARKRLSSSKIKKKSMLKNQKEKETLLNMLPLLQPQFSSLSGLTLLPLAAA